MTKHFAHFVHIVKFRRLNIYFANEIFLGMPSLGVRGRCRSYRGQGQPEIYIYNFYLQPVKIKMAMFFWYLVKSCLPSVGYSTHVRRTMDKSIFTRYQKYTTMYNWSPFMCNVPQKTVAILPNCLVAMNNEHYT